MHRAAEFDLSSIAQTLFWEETDCESSFPLNLIRLQNEMKFSKQLLSQVHYEETLVLCLPALTPVFTGRTKPKPKPTPHGRVWHLGGPWHGWTGLITCTLSAWKILLSFCVIVSFALFSSRLEQLLSFSKRATKPESALERRKKPDEPGNSPDLQTLSIVNGRNQFLQFPAQGKLRHYCLPRK